MRRRTLAAGRRDAIRTVSTIARPKAISGTIAPVLETRTFPAGSYIVRMDQPFSRVADALLDYQYWAPDDPQRQPYDDTAWTFPELFNVKATRVRTSSVLDAAVEPVKGEVKATAASAERDPSTPSTTTPTRRW